MKICMTLALWITCIVPLLYLLVTSPSIETWLNTIDYRTAKNKSNDHKYNGLEYFPTIRILRKTPLLLSRIEIVELFYIRTLEFDIRSEFAYVCTVPEEPHKLTVNFTACLILACSDSIVHRPWIFVREDNENNS